MFEYSEDEGQVKKRRNPFDLELKQLLLYYAQLQAQPESLDNLIPRILSSVGKVFTEFASYAQSLDFPHNCMLYPYNPYNLDEQVHRISLSLAPPAEFPPRPRVAPVPLPRPPLRPLLGWVVSLEVLTLL